MIIVVDDKRRFEDFNLPASIRCVADLEGFKMLIDEVNPDFVFIHANWRGAKTAEIELLRREVGVLMFSGASERGINIEELYARLNSIPSLIERCKINDYGREQVVTAVFDFIKGHPVRQRKLCEHLQAVLGTIVGLELLVSARRESAFGYNREEWTTIFSQTIEWIGADGEYSSICIKRCNQERRDAHAAIKSLIAAAGPQEFPSNSLIVAARLKVAALLARLRSSEAEEEVMD